MGMRTENRMYPSLFRTNEAESLGSVGIAYFMTPDTAPLSTAFIVMS